MKKLYAYSDNDGFIRFNAVGKKGMRLFNRRTAEYVEPEPKFNIPDSRIMWAAIIIGYVIGIVGMVMS